MSQNNNSWFNSSAFGNIASGAIGALGGIFGNIGARRQQEEAEQRQYNYARGLARYQNDMNMQNWQTIFNATNQYNTPLANMQRLKDAGINPHLGFGQGANQASQGSVQTQVGDVQTQAKPSILGGVMEKFFQSKAITAQLNSQLLDNETKRIDNAIKKEGLADRKVAERLDAEASKNKAQSDRDYYNVRYFDFNDPHDPGMTKYDESLGLDVEIKRMQRNLSKAQAGLADATAKNLLSNDQLVAIQTKVAQAQFDFLESDWFKKLPPGLQATFMALAKKLGGI